MKHDGGGGPWGGRDEDSSGSSSGGDSQRQPWGQPRRRRPDRPPVGPPAIEALLRKGRERLGGRLPEPAGRPLWLWGTAVFVLLWLLLTCVHRISPEERGVVTRLGRYVATLEPGISLTFPAPIDSVRKLSVDERTIENRRSGEAGTSAMLTADRNIVDVGYSVRWKVRDPELFAFGLADPQGTIGKVAETVMRGEVANAPLDQLLGAERDEIRDGARARMQALLDSYQAGITVMDVTITRTGPPKQVQAAFDQVAEAVKQRQQTVAEARKAAQSAAAVAQGEAAQFNALYRQYKVAPQVTRDRLYFDTMDQILPNIDKVVVTATGVNVTINQPRRPQPAQDQDAVPIVVQGNKR